MSRARLRAIGESQSPNAIAILTDGFALPINKARANEKISRDR